MRHLRFEWGGLVLDLVFLTSCGLLFEGDEGPPSSLSSLEF